VRLVKQEEGSHTTANLEVPTGPRRDAKGGTARGQTTSSGMRTGAGTDPADRSISEQEGGTAAGTSTREMHAQGDFARRLLEIRAQSSKAQSKEGYTES